MKKEHTKIVQEVARMTADLNALTVDKINETAAAPSEDLVERANQLKATAKAEGALWIEPSRRQPRLGKLDPKLQKQHQYDWEYVCGIFQHDRESGLGTNEPKKFWFCKYPGDEDCLWEIPTDRLVYIPRMIAQYLAGEKDPVTGMESMKFHTFGYDPLPPTHLGPDAHMEQFSVKGTRYRGRFLPKGAFA